MANIKKYKYTKDMLGIVVLESTSIRQVMAKLGIKYCGGNHFYISKIVKKYELDTTHFLGKASNRGSKSSKRLSPDEIFNRKLNRKENSLRLRRALEESGRDYRCSLCSQPPHWNGKPLVLQIDHINGNSLDNSIENLRFLCPNCHVQTENWGARNIMPR